MKSVYDYVMKGKRLILEYGKIYTREEINEGFYNSVYGVDWTRANNSINKLYKAGKLVRANGKRNQYMLVK